MARRSAGQLVVGTGILAVGVVILAARFVLLEQAPAWLLGVGFALALLGVVQRSSMPLALGMVTLGLGAALALADAEAAGIRRGVWLWLAPGLALWGLFLLRLVVGMRRQWWPLCAGAVLLLLAGVRALRAGAVVPVAVEQGVRTWWPVVLIVGGVWLVVRASQRR